MIKLSRFRHDPCLVNSSEDMYVPGINVDATAVDFCPYVD